MTEKILKYTGIRPMTDEQSEFFTKNLLNVFEQIDEMKGVTRMRGHTHETAPTTGANNPSDRSDPGDRENGPAA